MSNLAPGVIVFEKRPRWESELKRGLANDRVLVRPCRSATDLHAYCHMMRGSVAVIDYDVGPGTVLEWLSQALVKRVIVSPVIILPTGASDLEWPLRELGADSVLITPVHGDGLIRLCRSLLESSAASSAT